MSLQATALSFNLELIICTGQPLVDVQEANSSLESEKNVAVMSSIRFYSITFSPVSVVLRDFISGSSNFPWIKPRS